MEQAQYWMLMKRRQFLKSEFQVSLSENWEEKAFAEDAGWIWPPRSYTCSFCRREFRSAQALGGHMNVHRRDRAKLKQSDGPNNNENFPHQNQNPNPLKSYGSDSTAKRSLNNVITSCYDCEDGGIDCKRRKIGVCSTLPFWVVGVGGSMEELDLELRLGVQPKVK